MSMSPLYVLLGEVSIHVLCPFFNGIVCLPSVEFHEFFIYFGDQTLVQGIIGKCFLSSFFFFNFYCYSITVVCLFSPSLHPTPAEPTSLPQFSKFFTMTILCYERDTVGYSLGNGFLVLVLAPLPTVQAWESCWTSLCLICKNDLMSFLICKSEIIMVHYLVGLLWRQIV